MYQKYKYSTKYEPPTKALQRPRKKSTLKIRYSLLAVIVIIGVAGFVRSQTRSSNSEVQAVIAKPEYKIDEVVLDQKVNVALASLPANVATGVVVVNLETKKRYTYGTQGRFDAASVGKLVTATLYLHEVQDGKRKLTDKVGSKSAREQLQLMVSKSDNDAWRALNDSLTRKALNEWGQKIGMKGYSSEDNQLYPDDIATLLVGLHDGVVLDAQKKAMLYNWMAVSNNSLIRQYSPTSSKVYAKAGWLDDRHNEVAIIDNGTHPYALVVFARAANNQPFYKDDQNSIYVRLSTDIAQLFQ